MNRSNDIIKKELGIDLDSDPAGIDKLIEHIGRDEEDAGLVESSEDISCLTQDTD